jgi:hypothetical protein
MIATVKAAFNKKTRFTSKLDLNLRKKLAKHYIWSTALYGAEIWTLRKVDQKYLESFEMWCWRRMQKISWTDRVRNEEVLHRVKEERDILHPVKRRKANWIGHISRRNCLLKHVVERKNEDEGKRRRRRKQLLDDLKEIMGIEKGSTRSHPVENSLWKRLWTCRKADCMKCLMTSFELIMSYLLVAYNYNNIGRRTRILQTILQAGVSVCLHQ